MSAHDKKSWFIVDLTSDHVRSIGDDPISDAAPSFTSAPILGEEFQVVWAAEIDTRLPTFTLSTVSGSVALIRTISISASATVSAFRMVEFRTEGTRLSAARWNNIIRDDEELLLSI